MGQGHELCFLRSCTAPSAQPPPRRAGGARAGRGGAPEPRGAVAGALAGRSAGAASLLAALAAAARLRPGGGRRGPARRRALASAEAAIGGLTVSEVDERWEETEALGRKAEEIAKLCALLCCVHRELGYFAALHEGSVGSGKVVGKAPSLPLVLSWEGPGGLEETYGMCLALGSGATLLQELLDCVKQTQQDKRWGEAGENSATLRAKVSLLRGFKDISESPLDWAPGKHGLWYHTGQEGASRVYLPEVAERVARSAAAADAEGGAEGDGAEGGEASGGPDLDRVLQALATDYEREDDEEEDDRYDEGEEARADPQGGALPEGSRLYRFEVVRGDCPLSNLPTMKTRMMTRESSETLLKAQSPDEMWISDNSQLGPESQNLGVPVLLSKDLDDPVTVRKEGERRAGKKVAKWNEVVRGKPTPDGEWLQNAAGQFLPMKLGGTPVLRKAYQEDGATARFAALTASGSESSPGGVRAFIVPQLGAYGSSESSFVEGLRPGDASASSRSAGLDKVRRIFVIASVWDCYIDGCGLPERRCAWYDPPGLYKRIPLDLVVIDKLRKSGLFTELTVEQDTQERAIEVLLPLVGSCLESRDFTLIPIYVGGLMSERADQITKLLTPYLGDASNLFVVAGSIDSLASAGFDPSPGVPEPWAKSVPMLVRQRDQVIPTLDALDLFLHAAERAPDGRKLSLQSYW